MQSGRLLPLLLRDGALLAGCLILWLQIPLEGGGLRWTDLLAASLTVFCAYLLHEWGHLLGAFWGRSVVELAPSVFSVFLFKFDTALNNRQQFLRMSAGGFIASLVAIVLLLWLLPDEGWARRLTLVLTALGVLATFILELPSAWRVARGASLPIGAAFVQGAAKTQ